MSGSGRADAEVADPGVRDMYQIIDAVAQYGPSFDTPAVVVLGDVLRRNIEHMQAFANTHGVGLRPHVKTHKSVDIALMQMRAGAVGITVSNLYQAEVFAAAGIDDIFIAFPLWMSGPKARRVRRLIQGTRLTVGVDSRESVEAMVSQGFSGAERLAVAIEIECGAKRTGVLPGDAGSLAQYATERGLNVVGVFTYPGHGWPHGAAEGAAQDQAAALAAAAASLRACGIDPVMVSAGSTPTARHSISDGVTEIRPGEYVFYSMDSYNHEICEWDDIALFVVTTVVSSTAGQPQIVDVGTMALGREVNELGNYGWIAGNGGAVSRLNEYHGFLAEGAAGRHAVGSTLPLIPNHSCTVVQNVKELLILDGSDGTLESFPVNQFGRPH